MHIEVCNIAITTTYMYWFGLVYQWHNEISIM